MDENIMRKKVQCSTKVLNNGHTLYIPYFLEEIANFTPIHSLYYQNSEQLEKGYGKIENNGENLLGTGR